LNSLVILLGLETWKPVLTALLLPPVPLLLLVLIGARLIPVRRGAGWAVVFGSVVLLWLASCSGSAEWLSLTLLRPPPALGPERIKALKTDSRTPTAIVVLGGGMEPHAPEYGAASLRYPSLERLRYGLWLARETGLPVAFSGGVGWAQPDATAEARIAARIAATEFGRPLKWTEDESRDTRENASYSIALLKRSGIRHIVLVTHGVHMPRALRAFEDAARGEMRIEAAPMGLAQHVDRPLLRWLPSASGTIDVRAILRELVGRAVGA
jgi:uncharacterized SAM-binding protein YcdF (DUF218 family)